MALMRIQKYLSERGICSRREAERLLQQGLIKVNGQVLRTLGAKVDPIKDKVEVDQRHVSGGPQKLYIKLHKPVGYVSSNPQAGEKEARTLIPLKERLYNVGRLDKDSSGLLLFTNDGVFAYRLTHPAFEHEKEYEVLLDRSVPSEEIARMSAGLPMLGKRTQPCRITRLGPRTLRFILREGMNRQIRRMCEKVGRRVLSLKRLRMHRFTLGNLPSGDWVHLPARQVQALLAEKAA